MSKKAGGPRSLGWQPRQGPAVETTVLPAAPVWWSEQTGVLEAALESLVGRAEHMVVACSFLLASEALVEAVLQAADRGVSCYVLTATEAQLKLGRRDLSAFDEARRDEHLVLLRRLAGSTSVRCSNRFHAKCLLVDPLHAPQGILSTSNFVTDSLRRSVELAVELDEPEAASAFEILRWAYWEGASSELDGPDRIAEVTPLGQVSPPAPRRALGRTEGLDTIIDQQVRLLEGEPGLVVATSFGWGRTNPVVRRLLELTRCGVRVTVLCRKSREVDPVVEDLAKAGARVLGLERLHAKLLVSEGRGAVLATANLTDPGRPPGVELGLRLWPHDRRYVLVRDRLDSWIHGARWELANG